MHDKGQENRIGALPKTRSPGGGQMVLNPGLAGETGNVPVAMVEGRAINDQKGTKII